MRLERKRKEEKENLNAGLSSEKSRPGVQAI
jgi:hypothetical protein